ncbi:hypothetical protein ACX8Z9_11370 [Arthrobacter halodurans]|uniref:Acetone carboxylase n=1 Tax=Arthrobacter halodurans TaxID=516699 RepID=A0ABV4UM24_9MICC
MSLFDQLAGVAGPDVPTCSRKGCREPALWRLLWNNPRIHAPDRRKVWLACDAHVEWFRAYLSERGLWRETLPLAPNEPTQES